MIALTDRQLQSVMTAAGSLEPDRRDIFLQRVGVMLRMRSRFTDADVVEVAQLAGRACPADHRCSVLPRLRT
jgi:hypothetical protein